MTDGVLPRFVLTRAGKIGIGTDAPAFNLDVVNRIQVTDEVKRWARVALDGMLEIQ